MKAGDVMTNNQLNVILELLKTILKNSTSCEEAIQVMNNIQNILTTK